MSVLMYGANVWTLKNSISKLHSFEKFELFGHICRMNDNKLIKLEAFGVMDGTSESGRARRRWTDETWRTGVTLIYTLTLSRLTFN